MKLNGSVKSVDLRSNHIGYSGGSALLKMLTKNRAITCLKISGNQIPQETVEAIGRYIEIEVIGMYIEIEAIGWYIEIEAIGWYIEIEAKGRYIEIEVISWSSDSDTYPWGSISFTRHNNN